MRLYCIEDRRAPFVEAFIASSTANGFEPSVLGPCSSESSAFQKFRRVYQHMSINPEKFEIACFRRYFDVAKMVGGGERFVIADSDLLLNARPEEIPALLIEQGEALVASIGRTNGIPEGDVSPHFSFWTPSLVQRFVDYIIQVYETQASRLELIYRSRCESGNKRAAISDMTLLRMFIQDQSIPFLDSNQVVDGMVIDHNFGMVECKNATFKMSCGFKAFHRNNQRIYITNINGEHVQPIVLHLQGRAKVASNALLNGRDSSARLRLGSLSLARKARQWLG